MLQKRYSALACAAFLCTTWSMCNIAFANEIKDDANFELNQVIVTATKIEEKVADVPADVTIITAKEIEQKGANTLTEALSGKAGIQIKENGYRGSLANVFINGSDRVIILLDGKHITWPQGIASGAASFDLNSFVLMENIDRIEVVRGGASALYGADAVGGVINIITKKGNRGGSHTLDIGFGSNNAERYKLSTQGHEGKNTWFITANKEVTDGPRHHADFNGESISARFDHNFTDNKSLTLNFDSSSNKFNIAPNLDDPYLSYTDHGDVNQNFFGLTYADNHKNGVLLLKAYHNNKKYSGENFGSFKHDNKVSTFEYQDSMLNKTHKLTWGVDLSKDEVVSSLYNDTQKSRNNKAIYFQDQLDLSSKLSLTSGIRYEDNSVYGDNTSPKIALAYTENNTTNYFASWGKVFKAPKFDDLYASWGGNPDLRPETGWTSEFGIKKDLTNNSSFMATYFINSLEDAINWAPNSTGDWQASNVDKLKSNGINIIYNLQINDYLQSDYSYTYLNTESTDQSVKAPHNSFTSGFTYINNKFTQRISGTYLSEAYTNSRFVLDTRISYKLKENTTAYINMYNLLDKEYAHSKGYPAPGRSFYFGIKQSF